MVLVTGGTGFLGSTLIRQLLAKGVPVRATRRPASDIPEALASPPGLEWVDADVTDFFALEDAFDGVTQVYHCAAAISFDPADRKRLVAVNVEGTANVVTLALDRGARMLHVSSIAAMGRAKNGGETTEEDLWEYDSLQSGYAVTKYEAEMEVWRGIAEGLDAVIVNPSLIIGASARPSGPGTSGAIFTLLRNGLDFYTDGMVGLIDVEDVARAMILLMENPAVSGQRFVLNNVNMTHRELLEQCAGLMGRRPPKYRAAPWMLSLAWRAAAIWSRLSGKRPLLTRETALSASRRSQFSNRKLMAATGMTFKPITETLREICTKLTTIP